MNDLCLTNDVKKPRELDGDEIHEIMSRVYGMKVVSYTELNSYIDRNYYVVVSMDCRNPHINNVSADGYVLKLLNSIDSRDTTCLDAINSCLQHLDNNNILVHKPRPNIYGKFHSVETFAYDDKTEIHAVRLFSFITGQTLKSVAYDGDLCYQVGKRVAQMDIALKTLEHPYFMKRTITKFSLKQIPALVTVLPVITDPEDKVICQEVIDAFNADVLPVCSKLQPGIIHGDANHENIIVTPTQNNYAVAAFIDFGNVLNSYYVFELALTIAYLMIDTTILDELDVGGHVVAGFLSEINLSSTERNILRTLVAGRLVQSLIMGAYYSSLQPNNPYILATSVRGWSCLRKLWRCSKTELYEKWAKVMSAYGKETHER